MRKALESVGLGYAIDEGGGAFYGPKIDVRVKDSLGRTWQCSTIQTDFNLPERFDMTYIAQNGERERPVMIHRALLGSLERFFGILIENFGGAFPVWLAPVQAVILSVGERHADAVEQMSRTLKERLLRGDADITSDKIGGKIRNHLWQEKILMVAVVGDQEFESGSVTVRSRSGGDLGTMTLDAFGDMLEKMAASRE
ncbi:MAG: threonyl-tRNA synthetase [Planctomycetota bacterium]